jgi:hypothetical protein
LEEQLTKEKIPCEIGLARYAELAKGQMLGDEPGRLKILSDPTLSGSWGCISSSSISAIRFSTTPPGPRHTRHKVAALDGLNKF